MVFAILGYLRANDKLSYEVVVPARTIPFKKTTVPGGEVHDYLFTLALLAFFCWSQCRVNSHIHLTRDQHHLFHLPPPFFEKRAARATGTCGVLEPHL